VSAVAVGPSPERPARRLTGHSQLFGSTSIVIPCRNEASNLPRLVRQLFAFYEEYIFEIIIVNDSSTDETGAVAATLAATDPRVKFLNRQPPGGVGRALRDGYAAANGRFILSMDADFIELLPELRYMFDEIATGRDGAIGSRFTPGSLLVRYPLPKLICNRALHQPSFISSAHFASPTRARTHPYAPAKAWLLRMAIPDQRSSAIRKDVMLHVYCLPRSAISPREKLTLFDIFSPPHGSR
jgi:glycosyltransferase involved in cell wall biosynthesis